MSNSFQESVEYLLSLGNEVLAMKLGLENVRKLLRALGDPQAKYLKVQVAGTNGKGSVCAFLNPILTTAGIRVGMFTSPHLVSITERVQINGVEISEGDFARLATRVREKSEELFKAGELQNVPTFFEQVTAIALLAFADAKVEIAILETGLGGRLDATTAANAEICAITRIDIDHQQYLGETLAEIAAEKAAIIREGSLVVIGEQELVAERVILDRCRELDVSPYLASGVAAKESDPSMYLSPAGVGFGTSDHRPRPVVRAITFVSRRGLYGSIRLGIIGKHQIENAKTSILLAECLQERFPISDEDVMRGLTVARHSGRLEFIGPFLLDGAHNVGGAMALRAFLDEFVHGPITIAFGSMQDKDVKAIANILFPKADRLILTQPANSRALAPEDLLDAVPEEFDRDRISIAKSAEEALVKAQKHFGSTNRLILVTGSLYLVGEVRRILTEKLSLETEK